jgi:hypothetical protein
MYWIRHEIKKKLKEISKINKKYGPIVYPLDSMQVWSHGGMILTVENRRTRRNPCPSATMYTTIPRWTDPGAKPGLCGEIPTTNRLSYGTASSLFYYKAY